MVHRDPELVLIKSSFEKKPNNLYTLWLRLEPVLPSNATEKDLA
jgi:hypothetical protein